MKSRDRRKSKRRAWLQRRALRLQTKRLVPKFRRGSFGKSSTPPKPEKRIRLTVRLPEILSLHEDFDGTAGFFKSLEDVFRPEVSSVTIDHSRLRKLSPESALILLAEFQRLKFHTPELGLFAHGICASSEAEDILECIGYNDRFSIRTDRPNLRRSRHSSGVTFVKARSSSKVSMETVSELVDHFQELVGFSQIRSERLKVSLGEVMNNVTQHAYPDELSSSHRWARKHWWLLGYTDRSCKKLYFALFDQGVGMPTTLRPKWRDADLLLIPKSDAELVARAFSKGRSRTNKSFRGRGLTTLRRYINEAPSGELFVQTSEVQCIFTPRSRPQIRTTNVALAGTLMVWHVENASNGDQDAATQVTEN